MVFQPVPNTVEIQARYSQNAQPIQMTFHAEFLAPYVEADLIALANTMDFLFGTTFLPIQTLDCSYVQTAVRGLNSINDFEVFDASNAGPGGLAIAGYPNQVTLAVSRRSRFTGRSSRGRVYWIGLAQDQLDTNENFVLPGTSTAVGSAVNGIALGISGAGWVPVIVSRWSEGVKRPAGVTFPWVTTVVTDDRVDSRRDRMP